MKARTLQSGIIALVAFGFSFQTQAQSVPNPAKEQSGTVVINNATIHIGNGELIEKGWIVLEDGKITGIHSMQEAVAVPSNARVINGEGKHVYPGLIAANTRLGLTEVDALRQTRDFNEVGGLNPNVRAIIAYNTDSRITPTIRSNGVLLAQVVPQGGRISGTSTVVELDAWNWEDAAYSLDDGVHMSWPSSFRRGGWWAEPGGTTKSKEYSNQIAEMRQLFAEAKAYAASTPAAKNLRLDAMKGLFSGDQLLYIRVNRAKDIISAVSFAKDYGINPIIVGGSESHLITDFLVENKTRVIINQTHRLPGSEDVDIDLAYKLPKLLDDAGVEFCLALPGAWEVRNLSFEAGSAAAHGLSKERALQAITLDAAKVLGIDDRVGSLEVGKDATLIITEGDILDMRTSNVTDAFIRGKKIDLGNKQKDLYKKFGDKNKDKVDN